MLAIRNLVTTFVLRAHESSARLRVGFSLGTPAFRAESPASYIQYGHTRLRLVRWRLVSLIMTVSHMMKSLNDYHWALDVPKTHPVFYEYT